MTRSALHLKRNLILTTCLTAVGVCAPLVAHAGDGTATNAAVAATAAAEALPAAGTVVVTAERRTVDIQKAPLAITAVSARKIDQSFIITVGGLNGLVPGLEVTKASGFENLVSIRGVGSETPENSLTTVPGVAEFVDGVYIANTISLDQSLFDIDNIEVLRGPQGALYGQSSIGGAIIINTVQPKLSVFDGSADFSAGNYNLFRERGEVNLPLGDDFALRISAQKYDHNGFTRDALIPGFNLDDAHDVSGKAALLWRPTNQFSATFTVEGYHADQHGDAQKNINDPSPDPRVVFQDYPAHFELTTWLAHLNLEYDLPWAVLKSVTGYQDLEHVQREDSSRSAFSLIGEYDDVAAWNTTVHNWTEEFDILSPPGSRLEWVGGLFYLNQTSHQFVAEFECTTSAFQAPCAPPTPAQLVIPSNIEVPGHQPANLDYGNDSHAVHWSFAAFAQATYHFTDQFRITAGARYNHDYDADPSYNFSAFGTSHADNKASTDEPTWRVEGDYDVTPDNMVYLSAAEGYKPGGANGSYGQFLVPLVFQPETNTAFEVGSKNFFFDRTLRFNVSAFYYIHRNFQYIETDPIPFDGGISNVPRVDDYGVEFEGTYVSPDGRLNLDGTLALERGQVVGNYKTVDSTVANNLEGPNFSGGNSENFTTFTFGPCAFSGAYYSPACWAAVAAQGVNLNGKQPPDMPEVSGSASLSYRFDTPWGDLTPRVQIVYRGSEWARTFNDPTLDRVPSYTVTNLNVDFVPTGSHFRFSLTGTNVFNVTGINSRYTDPYGTFTTSNQYIPPAQIMGTIAYRY
jgi:iron complex outermembrane receptor protein